MQKKLLIILISSISILSTTESLCKKLQFKKTKPFYYELFLSKSFEKPHKAILGLTKQSDGTFGGLKRRGKGEDGNITIKESENGDAFVTADILYKTVSSKGDSSKLWINTIDNIEVQLSQELVSALRDKTVLSELYILSQEK